MAGVSRLVVRGDALHARARSARAVADEVESLGDHASRAADAAGVDCLATSLRTFAEGWQRSRLTTVSQARDVADRFDAINAAFARVDAEVAAAVRPA